MATSEEASGLTRMRSVELNEPLMTDGAFRALFRDDSDNFRDAHTRMLYSCSGKRSFRVVFVSLP